MNLKVLIKFKPVRGSSFESKL